MFKNSILKNLNCYRRRSLLLGRLTISKLTSTSLNLEWECYCHGQADGFGHEISFSIRLPKKISKITAAETMTHVACGLWPQLSFKLAMLIFFGALSHGIQPQKPVLWLCAPNAVDRAACATRGGRRKGGPGDPWRPGLPGDGRSGTDTRRQSGADARESGTESGRAWLRLQSRPHPFTKL